MIILYYVVDVLIFPFFNTHENKPSNVFDLIIIIRTIIIIITGETIRHVHKINGVKPRLESYNIDSRFLIIYR